MHAFRDSQSPSWHPTMVSSPLVDYFEKNLWIVFDGPAWGDTTVGGRREMLSAIAKHKPDQKPDIYFGAVWVAAQATHALLEAAVAAGDLSRAGLLRASEALGTVRYNGTLGDYKYGPADQREPPRVTTMFRVGRDVPAGLAVEQRGVRHSCRAELSNRAKEPRAVGGQGTWSFTRPRLPNEAASCVSMHDPGRTCGTGAGRL